MFLSFSLRESNRAKYHFSVRCHCCLSGGQSFPREFSFARKCFPLRFCGLSREKVQSFLFSFAIGGPGRGQPQVHVLCQRRRLRKFQLPHVSPLFLPSFYEILQKKFSDWKSSRWKFFYSEIVKENCLLWKFKRKNVSAAHRLIDWLVWCRYDHATVDVKVPPFYVPSELHRASIWGPTCDGIDCILKKAWMPEMDIGQVKKIIDAAWTFDWLIAWLIDWSLDWLIDLLGRWFPFI